MDTSSNSRVTGENGVPTRDCITANVLPVVSVVRYEDGVQRLIRRLKYDGDTLLATDLGAMLATVLSSLPLRQSDWQKTVIVAVPLHWRREYQRGYNQANLIARRAAHLIGLPCSQRVLRRRRATRPQYNLTREQRVDNLAGAFRANRSLVTGKCILLVDDVYTSGATLAACAVAAYKSGADRVVAATVARALPQSIVQATEALF